MKILIADDSEMLRQRLKNLLDDIPNVSVVGEAENAEEAFTVLQTHSPELVILDIRMPGNGMSIIDKIKAVPNAPVVVMFTNYPYEQYRQKCADAGADYFFDKSSGIEKVLGVVTRLAAEK